jgi:hypothetical protein
MNPLRFMLALPPTIIAAEVAITEEGRRASIAAGRRDTRAYQLENGAPNGERQKGMLREVL